MEHRKFSLSAIILMILLLVRIIGTIWGFFISLYLFVNIPGYLFAGIIILMEIFYLISFIGIFKKTGWGLRFALAIVILDLLFGGVVSLLFGLSLGGLLGLIIDLVLLGLITNILRRISRTKLNKKHV